MRLKRILRDLLENSTVVKGYKLFFDITLALLILLSIVLVILDLYWGDLPYALQVIDQVLIDIFIVEFILRFYIASDFRDDTKKKGLFYAIKQKFLWFIKPTSIIDFLAILPNISFFRVFRSFRLLRLCRLFRLGRANKSIRELDKLTIILRGMGQERRMLVVFSSISFVAILLIGFLLFIFESPVNTNFSSFKDSLWYTIKTVGFGEDTPKTLYGHILVAVLLLVNMGIVSFFISIIVTKIQSVMQAIASGQLGKVKLQDHIVICGYTMSSIRVIEELLKESKNHNRILLVTEKELDDKIEGVIYLRGDFTSLEVLDNANVASCKYAVVFAEGRTNDSARDIDLRTVLTIFHIEKIDPNIHTIAEIMNKSNAEIIKEKIHGDEILFKEKIDADIITNCIYHKNLSQMIYDLLDLEHKQRIYETTLKELEIQEAISIRELKKLLIDFDYYLLGIIDHEGNSRLSPNNQMLVEQDMRIIYIKAE